MPHSSDQDILNVLDAAGPQWAELQAWRVTQIESSANGAITVHGPAFIYRWEYGLGPVKVSFWTQQEGRIASGPGHLLAIEPGLGTIRLKLPGREPMVIGAVEPAIYQQIGELTSEAQSAMQGQGGERWSRDLIIVSAAMKLAALTREAAASASAPDRGARRSPRKDQLVTQLHEWLRPNLEKSVKLGDAAKRFDKSPRQLIRILKETTGAGFAEHLTMHRLTLARALLMRSGQSVMEVARASGFNSREQFIRSFNKAFGWTPLQFRKAWNQAALSDAELVQLCQVSERTEVEWLPTGSVASSPDEDHEGEPHTVVVANALHDIVELFWVTPQGKRARIDVLERGGMVFVNRDTGGSCWIVRVPVSGKERYFRTPDDHALAVVTAELMA
ncbi:AraC family transcriptional regulator [Luteolibacter flavescens]|uniref:AraC family transcriptional regulator n=1 Tax=Luteolibacter flavescens TaxID=1859460 RepID=A0ABT3FJV9_9BACT|nr:AraC family transcriptional regulator [Luteolibacter flavescens]MCW1883504.1 AraC family transcriptional regulator [Luteolibacter flavescens]